MSYKYTQYGHIYKQNVHIVHRFLLCSVYEKFLYASSVHWKRVSITAGDQNPGWTIYNVLRCQFPDCILQCRTL